MVAAALSSTASELNALATTTTIDLWRRVRPLAAADEARNVRVAKWLTGFWGVFAIAFALFVGMAENLIEAINILGSIFYGVVLGIFLVAFFLKWIRGSAVFWGAVAAQLLVFVLYFNLSIGYLWFNLIGCAGCVVFSLVFQTLGGSSKPGNEEGLEA
jgi:solute:Na+ symporter, SSS family